MAVVLLQSSKGNGLAGPIGGANVTMAFGVRRTSDLLTKSSTILAAVLMVGCIVVNLLIENKSSVDESIIQKNAGQNQQQMPPQNNVPPSENTLPPSGDQNQKQNNPDQSTQPPANTTPQDK